MLAVTECDKKIRVMVVSAQAGEAFLFRVMIDRTSDMQCVGIALTHRDALQQIPELTPDVLVTGVLRQGIEEFIGQVQQSHPAIHLLVNVPNGRFAAPFNFLNPETMLLLQSPLTAKDLQNAIRDAYNGKVGYGKRS